MRQLFKDIGTISLDVQVWAISERNKTELDCLHEFIEGLKPKFIVPVQSSIPTFIKDAIEKTKALETAFSVRMLIQWYPDIYKVWEE